MSLPVAWTMPARVQLSNLHAYISQDNSNAADAQLDLIVGAARHLADFPEIGREGRRHGTPELVIPGTPYIVVYRIRLASVRVLAVIHGARRWPRRFR
jgi:toxin ParE1/3/4